MFLYTNNKLSEKQIIPFTIASRAIKYIGINLTKEKRERTQINKIRNERGEIATDTTETQKKS